MTIIILCTCFLCFDIFYIIRNIKKTKETDTVGIATVSEIQKIGVKNFGVKFEISGEEPKTFWLTPTSKIFKVGQTRKVKYQNADTIENFYFYWLFPWWNHKLDLAYFSAFISLIFIIFSILIRLGVFS